jgi:hypothetical protein
MLIHRLGQIGDVEIGVARVGKCLELRVEGLLCLSSVRYVQETSTCVSYPGKADFIPEEVEPADTILCILVVVIFYKAEAAYALVKPMNQ